MRGSRFTPGSGSLAFDRAMRRVRRRRRRALCRQHGISEQTFYRWKQKYGGLERGEATRLKALEEENSRLKRLVAEQALDNQILKDLLRKTHDAREAAGSGAVGAGALRVSERRACRLVGIGRSTLRYHGPSPARGGLLAATAAGAGRGATAVRLSAAARAAAARGGDRQPQADRTDSIGRKVWRSGDGGASAWHWDGRGRAAVPERPNQQWGVDFVSDALAWGRRIRLFTVVDVFTREALAIEVDTSLPGGRVVRVLERLAAERGGPDEIVLDNGPELAGKAVDQWAYERGVGCALSNRESRSRTPSSRASRDAFATNVSTAIGSSA